MSWSDCGMCGQVCQMPCIYIMMSRKEKKVDPLAKMEHDLAVDNGKVCITEHEYLEFLKDTRSNHEAYKHMRTGQAFCNYFNLTNPDLFYATDEGKIITEIMKYIK